MTIRTLYLCYFGLGEPLVQTQVLPYLRLLAKAGIKIQLLTFEPRFYKQWSVAEIERNRQLLDSEGIGWFTLPYHKSPSALATAYDILAGARFAIKRARRERLDVLHARSHVPLAMALLARLVVSCRLIFDFRGLMADEYVDAGIWTEWSPLFRAVKMIERAGFRRADHIVVLTRRMRDWLIHHQAKPATQIEVIPCCVDLARFEKPSQDLGNDVGSPAGTKCFEVVYAGSLIGLYLVEEMGRFFLAIKMRQPLAFLRILSISFPEPALAALKRAGLGEKDFQIDAVEPDKVPALLRGARLGVSFRKPTISQIAASPTKIPEYLAAGLPVVSNEGIGDIDELLTTERVGVLVKAFDHESLTWAASAALKLAGEPNIAERCRDVARRHFDLERVGGARYLNVYRRLEG